MKGGDSLLWLSFLSLLSGCIASNVVEPGRRVVTPPPTALEWTPARQDDVPGYYESIEVSGEAAGALLKVYYYFTADGDYAGAALIVAGTAPEFQVLGGKWSWRDGKLAMDDGEPVTVLAAPGHLELRSDGGAVRLARREIH